MRKFNTSALKSCAQTVALIVMAPAVVAFLCCACIVGRDAALHSWSQLFSLLPGTFGCYLRGGFYRFALRYCAPSARIEFGTLFSKFDTILEENVYIGPYCLLGSTRIGADTLIGPGTHIPSGPHTHGTACMKTPIRLQPGEPKQVSIGRNCWIAANCVVLEDVGDDSVVGAGSVVTAAVPPATFAAGVPARPIRSRVDATANGGV